MSAPLPYHRLDGRKVSDKPGEPDVHVPGHFWVQVAYVLFSLSIVAFGTWLIWAPLSRLVAGEISESKVVHIVRTEPGVPDQTIRFARDIPEQEHTVRFQHFVAVEDEEGRRHVMRLGVDSARQPYARVNEIVKVIHFPDDTVAFGLLHHRTWAFGAGYLAVGFILSMLSINSLWAVGKPIVIDPENPEELEEEAERLRQDEERRRQPEKPASDKDVPKNDATGEET